MKEYKINNATVRVYGQVERDKIEQATEQFMKRVIRCIKEKEKISS